MSNVLSIVAPCADRAGKPETSGGVLDLLLREQQSTAIDKFSQWHAAKTAPLQARYYRDLIPLSRPGAGRAVRLRSRSRRLLRLQGLRRRLPQSERPGRGGDVALRWACCTAARIRLPVLAARDHRLPSLPRAGVPGGLSGAGLRKGSGHRHRPASRRPVHRLSVLHFEVPLRRAEVQPLEGDRPQVRHVQRPAGGGRGAGLRAGLSESGDSHRDRSIRQEIAENAEANLFLPGAPEPGYTLPTTVYKTRKAAAANLLPADYYAAAPQHAHWPLVLMLVLTQMSVGRVSGRSGAVGTSIIPPASRRRFEARGMHLAAAFVLGMFGLAASSFTWADRGWPIGR